MQANGSGIGASVARSEDVRFLQGKGCFIDDFKLPGMCYAVVVRSQVAHGVIVNIDTSAAREMPGVLEVFTYDGIAAYAAPIPIRVGPIAGLERYLQFPLARDRVRYVGEPIAVVIATDRYVAEDAAEQVFAEIDPLDPVVETHEALKDASVIHEEVQTNLAAHYHAARGNIEQAFANAEYTRKETFRCHRHSSVPLETRGLVAHWDVAKEKMQVWGAAKVPFYNRRLLAKMLQLDEANVDLLELDVGGSFGARGEFYPEDFLIPFAAKLVQRPVKWIEDRRENLLCMNHSREMDCELEIAARKDGTVLGLRARLFADIGAYARTTGGLVPAKAATFLPGPYRISDYACEVHAVITNKTPSGTFRGPGRYEANFFRERLIDMMAADLGLDPAEVRLRNLIRPEEMPYNIGALVPYERASEYDTGDYPAALQQALEAIDYKTIKANVGKLIDGKLHGVGIGCFVDSTGAGPSEAARIMVREGGALDLFTGTSSSGQGHETTFAQILAHETGVAIETITLHHGSTTCVENGFGTYHGRGLVMGGSAVKVAAQALIDKVVGYAAKRAGVEPDKLEFRCGEVFLRDRLQASPLTSLALLVEAAHQGDQAAADAIEVNARFEQSKLTFEYGTQVAHIAIDPATSMIDVLRFVTVEDCGTVINPMIVHGQVIGAAVQGLGGTLMEQFQYDEAGQMISGSFADYLLPTSTDFPYVEAFTLDAAPSKLNPLGAKGVGEGGIEATGAALANALASALAPLGVQVFELPLSPNNIARWIREAKRGAA